MPSAVGIDCYAPLRVAGIVALIGPFSVVHGGILQF